LPPTWANNRALLSLDSPTIDHLLPCAQLLGDKAIDVLHRAALRLSAQVDQTPGHIGLGQNRPNLGVEIPNDGLGVPPVTPSAMKDTTSYPGSDSATVASSGMTG